VRLAVERYRSSDNRRVGSEAARPHVVAEQHGLRSIPFALLGRERAPELRLHAQDMKEVIGDRDCIQAFRFTTTCQHCVADAVEREVASQFGQRLRSFTQVQHVPDLSCLAGETAGVVVGNPDEPLGIGKWQRT